jgi:hypothetical protein
VSGVKIASVEVRVNGKRVQRLSGRHIRSTVDLRGLPRGRFTIKVIVATTTGRRVTDTRHYRTCTPRH